MHTPAKGAGPNKGLGGSNPPFSAINPIKSTVYERKGDSSYISSYTLTEAEAFDICRRPFCFCKKSHTPESKAPPGVSSFCHSDYGVFVCRNVLSQLATSCKKLCTSFE